MIELKKSNVHFNEAEHTYNLDGKELKGITSTLLHIACPDMYKNKDMYSENMKRAANRGSAYHKLVSDYINHLRVDVPDNIKPLLEYTRLHNINFTMSEFLVSDEENFASSIDLIDENLNLYDIKTVSSKSGYHEYVSWQLSIYNYLLFKQCGTEAKDLFAIFVNLNTNKISFEQVQKKSFEDVEYLMNCYLNDIPFEYHTEQLITLDEQSLQQVYDAEIAIANLDKQIKELKEQQDTLRSGLLKIMVDNNIKHYESDKLKLTVKDAYTKNTFDSKKFKEDYPEMYEQYLKETIVSNSLMIKIL